MWVWFFDSFDEMYFKIWVKDIFKFFRLDEFFIDINLYIFMICKNGKCYRVSGYWDEMCC